MMANEFRTLDSHSAEYFGDTRDHWWNPDFLELIGRRLSFDAVQDVLDVGSGVGHWGQMLANVLPKRARVHGVDRDPLWVEKAAVRAAAYGPGDQACRATQKTPAEAEVCCSLIDESRC
jgi:trans-aconitate methyltransferase